MGKTNKKPPAKSYKEVAADFLAAEAKGGVAKAYAVVKKLVDGLEVSKATLHRAGEHLAKKYGNKQLAQYAETEYPLGARGRSPPSIGDVRPYKMQQSGGRNFLRIPGDHLQVPKKGSADVAFEPGPRIVITPRKKKRRAA